MSKDCVDERFLFVCDTLFTFALHYTRVLAKIDFGYELTMKFGNPFNMKVETSHLLMIASLTVLVGWFSDSVAGKWYVMLLGMTFAILSCLMPLISKYVGSPGQIGGVDLGVFFMFAYMTTAGVRNAVILEQVGVTTRISSVRKYLFWLTTLRVCMYNIIPLVDVLAFNMAKHPDVFSIVSLSLVTLCFLYFLATIHNLYTEPTYFLAWEKCMKCMVESIVNRVRKVPKTIEVSTEKVRSVLKQVEEENKQKKQVRFKSLVQFKSISYGENFRPWTLIKFWGYHAVSSPKKMRKSLEKKPSVDLDVEEESTSFKAKTEEKKQEKLKKSLTKIERHFFHDLLHAPSSEFAVDQTEKFLSCLVLILTPFLFTLLIFTILTITEYQVNFVDQPEYEIEILSEYNFYFDAILFPIFHFLIHPVMTNVNVRDWHYVFIGYLFLLLATFSSLLTQLNLESTIVDFPQNGHGSIRLYNALNVPYSVKTSWESKVVEIKPFDSLLYEALPVGKDVKIENINGKSFDLEIIEKQTISYIITEKGLQRNSKTDPNIFDMNDRISSSVFLVTDESSISIVFEDVFKLRRLTLQSDLRGASHFFVPDKYVVKVIFLNKTNTTLGKVEVEPLTLYSYFYALNSTSPHGVLMTVGGPKTLKFHFLLFQLIFLSLANVITSACFYTIVFIRAPEKLRSTVFSIIFAVNLVATATYNAYLSDASSINVFKVLITHVVLSGFLALWQLAFSSNLET